MFFGKLYARTMQLAAHKHAERYLAGISMIESIFFPVPTALMVAPMAVARPDRALPIAVIATLASVFGGIFGYLLGYYAIQLVEPLIQSAGYWDKYQLALQWFGEWGFWAVIVAGFSPIPFKLFTISAGAMSMSLLPFLFAALIGRASQFFLVSLSMAWAGPKFEPMVRKYIEWLGWGSVVLLVIAYLLKTY
jgi:membrane protein YqaA with SNARE-associated domain